MNKADGIKNVKMSTSAARKANNSRIWREKAQAIRIIDENATLFISQENIKIIKLNESHKSATSFSAIISSKGTIVIE